MKQLHIIIALVLYITIFFAGPASPNSKTEKLAQPIITAGKELKKDALKVLRGRVRALKLPFVFEENRGQTDARVHFLARAPGHTFFLTGNEAILTRLLPVEGKEKPRTLPDKRKGRPGVRLVATRMKLVGARTDIRPVAEERQQGKVNYFIGKDPKKWRKDIAAFSRVLYGGVYQNIDLVYHTDQSRIRYDFVVNPGGDPNDIRLVFPDAKRIEVDGTGDLVITSDGGVVRHSSPRICQIAKGHTKEVTGGFVVKDGTAAFRVGPYDPGLPLIIDPVIVFSTYYGGNDEEGYSQGLTNLPINAFGAFALTVDAQDQLLVAGMTMSADLPVTDNSHASNTDPNASWSERSDAFVLRVSFQDPSAPSFIATYFGGSDFDEATGIGTGSSGAVYVTGSTRSPDLPRTEGAFAPTLITDTMSDRYDAFVAKLNEDLQVVRTTYLRTRTGWPVEWARAIAVDEAGGQGYDPGVYVVGIADKPPTGHESEFTTPGAFQQTHGRGQDGFAAKLSIDLSSLRYYTYLGGNSNDYAFGVAVRKGRAYIAGLTASMDFPVRGGAVAQPGPGVNPGVRPACVTQPYIPGCSDGFVMVLDETGGSAVYSTYLGGENFDALRGIAVDAQGNAYVVGASESGLADRGIDIMVAELRLDGSLAYMKKLGGVGEDVGTSLVVDTSGNAHVTGWTGSDGLASPDAAQAHLVPHLYSYEGDAFYAIFDADGNKTYFSYFGGSTEDLGLSIARDSAGGTYIGGITFSGDLPLVHPIAGQLSGNGDIFLAKFAEECVAGQLSLSPKSAPSSAELNEQMVYTLYLANSSSDPATCVSLDDDLPSQVTFLAVNDSRCTYLPGQNRVSCRNLSVGAQSGLPINIIVRAKACGTAVNTATMTPWGGTAQTASASTTICPLPAFTKTQVTPVPAAVGLEVRYGLSINNRTSSSVTVTEVKDTLPQFLQYEGVDISPQNSTISCSFDASMHRLTCLPSGEPGMSFPPGETTIGIRTKATSCGQADNTAQMRLPGQQNPLMSNTVTTTINLKCPVPLFEKVSLPSTGVGVNESVKYRLTITNDTPGTLSGMRMKDMVPAQLRVVHVFGSNCTVGADNSVECSGFDVPPGGRIIDIETTATACGTFSNTAMLFQLDGSSVNATSETRVDRNCPEPPTVTLTGPNRATKGDSLDYRLKIVNPSNPLVTHVNVVDEVTSQLQLYGLQPCTGNDCPYLSDDRHWKLNNLDLPAGVTKEFTISAKVVGCGPALNTVSLSSPPEHPALSGDVIFTTDVDCPPPLRSENEVCNSTAECESPLVCAQTCALVKGECSFWFGICWTRNSDYWLCDTDYHCLQPQDDSPGFRRKD